MAAEPQAGRNLVRLFGPWDVRSVSRLQAYPGKYSPGYAYRSVAVFCAAHGPRLSPASVAWTEIAAHDCSFETAQGRESRPGHSPLHPHGGICEPRGINPSHGAGLSLHSPSPPRWRTEASVLFRRDVYRWRRAQRDSCRGRAVEQFRLPGRVTGFDELSKRRVCRWRRCTAMRGCSGGRGVL